MVQLFNPNTGEKELINARLNFQDKSYSGTAIFLIYGTNHWISCVVTKNSNEVPKFLFADSLGGNCNDYQYAKVLIKLLITPTTHGINQNSENKTETESTYEHLILPFEFLFNEHNDERFDRMKVEVFIEDLKEGKNLDKTILISGPPKTGKLSLAYNIAVPALLPFIKVEATSLIGDLTMFNKKNENENIDINNIDYKFEPIDLLFCMIKDRIVPALFIHALDKLLLKANSNDSKKLLINFLLNKLINYQKNNKILFIISSHIPYAEYPKNTNFSELCSTSIKFDLPDYNKRFVIILHYIATYKDEILEAMKDKVEPNGKKIPHGFIRRYDIDNLCTMTSSFNCDDIKKFVRLATTAKIKGIKSTGLSDSSINWKSRNLINRPYETIMGNYNPICFAAVKLDNWLESYDRDYTKNLYSYWYIQSEDIKARKELEGSAYQSYASYFTQAFNESENIQFTKDIFIYIANTKIGQAATEGAAEVVKDAAKIGTKKGFKWMFGETFFDDKKENL